jgi:hypothetical protein
MKEKDLVEFADELPRPINKYKSFSKTVSSNQSTPIGKVKINIFYAFSHLTKNTYCQNRFRFVGGFSDSLKNPLFVFKGKYKDKDKEVDSYCFYKPFFQDGKIIHLFNMSVEKNGSLYQKTFFNSTSGFKKLKKMFLNDELVYNHPKIDNKLFETELDKSNPRGVVDEIIANCLKNVNKKEIESSKSLDYLVEDFEKISAISNKEKKRTFQRK